MRVIPTYENVIWKCNVIDKSHLIPFYFESGCHNINSTDFRVSRSGLRLFRYFQVRMQSAHTHLRVIDFKLFYHEVLAVYERLRLMKETGSA